MFDRLLIAVDGSEASLHALEQSFALIRAEKSSAKVVSVVPPYEGDLRLVGVKNIHAMMRQPYEAALAQASRAAESQAFELRFFLEEGEPDEQIVGLAESEGCDVIVIGVRDANSSEMFLMGSIAARVVGSSPTHVLVIPYATTLKWNRVLVAVDGSPFGDRAEEIAFYLQRAYGSSITLLCAADVPSHIYGIDPSAADGFIARAREVLDAAVGQAQSSGARAEVLLREGDPADSITEEARKGGFDLILIGSHGRKGLKRLLMGSVTERVIARAPCPVLVAKI
ncbi:MAG: universal stress protein [Thermodesulfobacteriota bacterium]